MQRQDGMVSGAMEYFGTGWDDILDWYLKNGVVYSDDTLFVLAIKHNKKRLLERNYEKELDKCDSWYIQYVAGDLRRLFEIMPEKMEWAVFERHEGEPPRCYKLDRIRKKLGV